MIQSSSCLVLGGTGFIGSHLVRELVRSGCSVRLLVRTLPRRNHPFIDYFDQCELVLGDFRNRDVLDDAVAGCAFCFHLVSTTLPKNSNDNPAFDVESNLVGTVNLLESCVRHQVRKIIFTSSGGTVYGLPVQLPIQEDHVTQPLCSYGIVKLGIEKYLHLYHHLKGLDYTVLRIANPYGEMQRVENNQGVVSVFMDRIMRGERLTIWGDGSVVRDYIHISDVVSALMKARAGEKKKTYNIGSGHGVSLRELVRGIEQVTGRRADCCYEAGRKFDVPDNVLCIRMAEEYLQWRPVCGLSDGLTRLYRWKRDSEFPAGGRA